MTQQSFSHERGEKQFAVEKALFLQLVPAQIEENEKLLRANKLLFCLRSHLSQKRQL